MNVLNFDWLTRTKLIHVVEFKEERQLRGVGRIWLENSFIPYYVLCLISILLFILQDMMQQQQALNGFKCVGAWPYEVTRPLN